jgi:hypothetical protein
MEKMSVYSVREMLDGAEPALIEGYLESQCDAEKMTVDASSEYPYLVPMGRA